jgi:DNA polymerase III delta subunit
MAVQPKVLHIIPVSEWKPGSTKQLNLAKKYKAKFILFRPDEKTLPKWVNDRLSKNGLSAIKIGYSTYKSNTYAVFKI